VQAARLHSYETQDDAAAMAATTLIPTHLRSSYKLSKSAFSVPAVRRAAIAIVITAAILGGFCHYHYTATRAARKEALDYVLFPSRGQIGSGYDYIGFWRTPISTILIADDRMDDRLASQLVNIYDLSIVTVYSPVRTEGRWTDVPDNTWTVPSSLRKLDLPMSEISIAALERRFPRLKVYILKPVGVRE
jgi:hypothetical protein